MLAPARPVVTKPASLADCFDHSVGIVLEVIAFLPQLSVLRTAVDKALDSQRISAHISKWSLEIVLSSSYLCETDFFLIVPDFR